MKHINIFLLYLTESDGCSHRERVIDIKPTYEEIRQNMELSFADFLSNYPEDRYEVTSEAKERSCSMRAKLRSTEGEDTREFQLTLRIDEHQMRLPEMYFVALANNIACDIELRGPFFKKQEASFELRGCYKESFDSFVECHDLTSEDYDADRKWADGASVEYSSDFYKVHDTHDNDLFYGNLITVNPKEET